MDTRAKRIKGVTRPEIRIDDAALEDPSRRAVELITTWRGTVVRVDVLRAAGKTGSRFTVGEDPKCDLSMPAAALCGHTALPLVAHPSQDGAAITVPADATGDVTMEDGRRFALADLPRLGLAAPCDDLPGCARLLLPPAATAVVELGGFTFIAKSIPEPRPLPAPFRFDWDNQIFSGASLAFHFLVVFITFFDVPALLAL